MPQLGLAGEVGFNRHRRDGTKQVWGGHTHIPNVSYMVREALNDPMYTCNRAPQNSRTIYGPRTPQDVLGAQSKQATNEYKKATKEIKTAWFRPLPWPREANGQEGTYKTMPPRFSQSVLDFEQAKEACCYYPHQPRVIMKTVMNFADDFKPTRSNRQSPIFMAMGVQEIAENILERLPFASRAHFSRTCSDAMIVTGRFQILYDLSRIDLQHSEYTEDEFARMKQNGVVPERQEQRGTKYLLVSQTHLEYINEKQDVRDPDHPPKLVHSGYRRFATYCTLAESIARLTRSIFLRGANTEHLTLHRVPFANGKVIAGWVKHMPKLKCLEIIGCEMVRFHDMATIYRDMGEIQKDRGTKISVEISPLRETGTRWENRNEISPGHEQRSGEFVVCWADVGVKIPTAVVVELYWQLFPAMVEAGQWESIFDFSSATRQFLERLPMPKSAIPILIRIFSEYLALKQEIENAEASWIERHSDPSQAATRASTGDNAGGNAAGDNGADDGGNALPPMGEEARATPNPSPRIYNPQRWPSTLRRQVTKFMVKRNHAFAFAMFGTERWIETADRNEMSTNTQCRTDNYGLWGTEKTCFRCKIRLPMMAFTGGGVCENCRLQDECADEDDHLKKLKRSATRSLGFDIPPRDWENQTTQRSSEATGEELERGIRDITASNFPKPRAFLNTGDGGKCVSLVEEPGDLIEIMSNSDGSLSEFFSEAVVMDLMEVKQGRPVGRIGFSQKKHSSGEYLPLGQSSRQMAGHYMYRQSLSVEDFMKTPNGLTPKDVKRIRGGF